MNAPATHPDAWDNDPLTQHVSEHIRRMPDLPPVALVLIVRDKSKDADIIKACAKFKETYVQFMGLEVFGISFGVCILGLYPDTEVNPCAFLEHVATLPYDEAAIYVGGGARIRLAPVVRRADAASPLSP